jgi:hypothetical protein
MPIDHLSLSTTPVFLWKGKRVVSQGTGFYFGRQAQGQAEGFLVTNYHMLTGRDPLEAKPPRGDSITIQLHKTGDTTSEVREVRLPLFTTEGQPVWVVSESTPEADLGIIPLPSAGLGGCNISCISSEWATESRLKVRPTSNVTLIGYPCGYYDTKNALPIWKTGTVASEPDIDFEGKPYFLVDVSAFPGMSGAPVCAIAYGTYETEAGNVVVGGARRFLGVFASMMVQREHRYLEELEYATKPGIVMQQSLDLGRVWKAKLLLETVDGLDTAKYESEIVKHLPQCS